MNPSTTSTTSELISRILASDQTYTPEMLIKDFAANQQTADKSEKKLIDVKECMTNWLPVSRMSIFRYMRSGELQVVRLGKRVFFDIDDLKKFIKRNKKSIARRMA